ncbi:MAG: hypothetical protein ACYC8W_11035 [Candidatus Tyrphobacter sp.]
MALFSGYLSRALRAFLAFSYLVVFVGGAAQAQHVLPVLGTAPLLGAMSSTADLQERVRERHAMFETAAQDLGLTDAETQELVSHIMSGQVRWGVVPQHLDAMTWAWDGSVYMYRDVVIPAGEYGWETDIRVGPNVHALFIPAACGNLSLVERSEPVAYVPPPPPPPPPPSCPNGLLGNPPDCYQPQCPNGMMGAPPNCYQPQCPNGMMGAPPNCYQPACQAGCQTPPPALTQVVVRTTVRQDVSWWLIPLTLIGFFFGGHYHNQPPPYGPPPGPPPVKCPPVDP